MIPHTINAQELAILKSAVEGTKATTHFHAYGMISFYANSLYNKGLIQTVDLSALGTTILGKQVYDYFDLGNECGYVNYDWSDKIHRAIHRHNNIAIVKAKRQ